MFGFLFSKESSTAHEVPLSFELDRKRDRRQIYMHDTDSACGVVQEFLDNLLNDQGETQWRVKAGNPFILENEWFCLPVCIRPSLDYDECQPAVADIDRGSKHRFLGLKNKTNQGIVIVEGVFRAVPETTTDPDRAVKVYPAAKAVRIHCIAPGETKDESPADATLCYANNKRSAKDSWHEISLTWLSRRRLRRSLTHLVERIHAIKPSPSRQAQQPCGFEPIGCQPSL